MSIKKKIITLHFSLLVSFLCSSLAQSGPENTRYLPSVYSLLLDDGNSVFDCREVLLKPWSSAQGFPSPFQPTWPTLIGDQLYFVLNDQLAVTDGTEQGTQLVSGGNFSSQSVKMLTTVGDQLFFVANDGGGNGEELWVMNSSSSVPTLVKDIAEGELNIVIEDLIEFQGKLFFLTSGSSSENIQDEGLWVSDGSAIGTYLIKDFDSNSQNHINSGLPLLLQNERRMIHYKNRIIFAGYDSVSGREPWISDGTSMGTNQLAEINTFPNINAGTGSSSPTRFTVVGDNAYFVAKGYAGTEESRVGEELYVYDGNTVSLVKDINLGSEGSVPRGLVVTPLATNFFKGLVDNTVLFNAVNSSGNVELWASNDMGTFPLTNFRNGGFPNVEDGIEFNNKLFFNADTSELGNELWVTDGTISGTNLNNDFIEGSLSSNPKYFATNDDFLFFEASTINSSVPSRQFIAMDKKGQMKKFNSIKGGNNGGVVNLNGSIIFFRGELSGLWKIDCPKIALH